VSDKRLSFRGMFDSLSSSVSIRSLIAILLLISSRAAAHEWYTGRTNAAGLDCCGGVHCHPVPDGAVTELLGGYRVVTTLRDPDLGYTYSIDHVYGYAERMSSPDGHAWCRVTAGFTAIQRLSSVVCSVLSRLTDL